MIGFADLSKKMLLLTHCFPPYAFPEAYLAAKRLGNIPGFEVDVLTMHAFFPWVKVDEQFQKMTNQNFHKIQHISPPQWYKKLPFHRLEGLFSLPDPYLYLNFLYKKHLKNLEQYDVVMTWSMYHSIHLLGSYIKRKFPKLPWMAHFSDPWTTNPFFQKNSFITKINKSLEKKVIYDADFLSFTSDETVENFLCNYPSYIREKVHVIPHNYDDELYRRYTIHNTDKEKFIIRYLGGFYGDRKPDSFIKALRILARDHGSLMEKLSVEFIGASQLKYEISENESKYISFYDSVDYISSLKLMQESDLLLVIDAPFENSPFLPSKLIDYIGANKPIFGITPPGTSQKLIEEIGFPVAHPNDPEEIAHKLLKMIKSVQSGQCTPIPDAIRDRYSAAAVSQRMRDILHKFG